MEPEQKSNGALIGSIIIVIILIIGGIYFWQTSLKEEVAPNSDLSSSNTSSLEADLNSIDLDSLDEGI